MLHHPPPNGHAFLGGGLIAASETANLGSGLRDRRQVAGRGGLCVALATQCLSKMFIFVYMCVCMHACASCLCERVCICVQACTQRSEGGIRSPLSLSIPLRQGLSLKLGFNFSWLGWKLASASDPPVFVSQS